MMTESSDFKSFRALISPGVRFLDEWERCGSEVTWVTRLLAKLSTKLSLPGGGVHPEEGLEARVRVRCGKGGGVSIEVVSESYPTVEKKNISKGVAWVVG